MTDLWRVGLIGCGLAAEIRHVSAIRSLPETFRLVRCFDVDPQAMERVAYRTGAQAGGLADLLSDVDIAVITSAPYLRARHAIAACRAQLRGILVAPPVGMTAAETSAVIRVAEETGAALFLDLPELEGEAMKTAFAALGESDARPLIARFLEYHGPELPTITAHTESSTTTAVFDADEIYTEHATSVITLGLDAPRSHGSALRLMHHQALPALALARTSLGTLSRTTTASTFGGGAQLALESASGALVEVTSFASSADRSAMLRADWSAPGGRVVADFPSATGSTRPTTVVIEDGNGSRTMGELDEPGERGVFRRLAAHLEGSTEVHYSLRDTLADQELLESAFGPRDAVTSPQRTVLLGAGIMSTTHLAVAQSRGRVIRVASRTRERAEARARLVDALAVTFDDPMLFADATAVIVAGVPSGHARLARLALERGLPVLVEKPFTATVRQARDLAELARTSGVRLVHGENWAFRPDLRVAAERAITHGVRNVEIRAHWMTPTWGDYLDPSHGGGVLFDAGSHVIELARMLLGYPAAESVSARLIAGATGTDVGASFEIAFEAGKRASIVIEWGDGPLSVSASAPGFALQLAPSVSLSVDEAAVELPRSSLLAGGLINDGIIAEHEALTGDAAVCSTAEDGVQVIEIIAAAYLSAGRGTSVLIPFDGNIDATPFELWTGSTHAEGLAEVGRAG